MTTCKDIMKRIQKYDGIHLFLVLDKNGKKLNDDLEEEEKKVTQNTFNSNYSDIPKLVEKIWKSIKKIIRMLNALRINTRNHKKKSKQ